MFIYVYMNIYTYIYTHTYMYIYIYIDIYIYTCISGFWRSLCAIRGRQVPSHPLCSLSRAVGAGTHREVDHLLVDLLGRLDVRNDRVQHVHEPATVFQGYRCRAKMAHIAHIRQSRPMAHVRESRPDSVLGFQVEVIKLFSFRSKADTERWQKLK